MRSYVQSKKKKTTGSYEYVRLTMEKDWSQIDVL